MKNNKALRILSLEDNPADAEMIRWELRRGGLDAHWRQVQTSADYLAELDALPDLILADYCLPTFDGLSALKLLRERRSDIPFILISGQLGEDSAVEAMKNGATDYVLKKNLNRLVPAVRRALLDAEERARQRQTREALRESEERLRSHIENSPLAVVEWDQNFIITRWAGQAEKILGWSAEETVGKSIAEVDMIYSDDLPLLQDIMRRFADGVTRQAASESRNVTKAGSIRHCVWHSSALLDANGKMHSVLSLVEDITARKESEAALRESEARFRIMANSAPILIWTAGLDMGATWFNQPWLTFTGRTLEQELGKGWTEGVHPDDLEGCLGQYAKAFEDRREFEFDYRLRRQDGQWRWILDHGCPLYRGAEFLGYIGSCKDITARKEAEEGQRHLNAELEKRVEERTQALGSLYASLRLSEEKFRTWTEQAPNLIFVRAGNGVVYANRRTSTLLGYSQEEFCAPDFDLGSMAIVRCADAWKTLLRDRMPATGRVGEFTLRKRSGRLVDVLVTTRPIDYEHGSAQLWLMIDITQRKRAERLSLARHKRLQHLAAKLATAQDVEQRRIGEGLHDDVAQLLAICNIKLEALRGEKRAANRNRICGDIYRLICEADEKLHFLSFELGASTLHQGGLEKALQELCDRMVERCGIKLELTSRGTNLPASGEVDTVLFKIARELLFNVVKHAAVKEASIALVRTEDETRIEVTDHGKGFSGLGLKRISSGARGLGLFAVRERLRDLNGELSVRSVPGVETRVTVKVPNRK